MPAAVILQRLTHRTRPWGRSVEITVAPAHDPRMAESYSVDPRELVRFCWAVLADLEPEEAHACAEESGVDLNKLSPPPLQRGAPRMVASDVRRPARIVNPGSKSGRVLSVLAGLSGGGATVAALRLEVPDARDMHGLLAGLRRSGLVDHGSGTAAHRLWRLPQLQKADAA